MSITINTNMAAARASYQLSKNNSALQKSLNRLASGSRITKPSDDAGGLAVAMKLKGSINRLNGVEKNIGNAVSFLQVQDGILDSAGKIMDRNGGT
jgi:flagellin